MPIPLRADFDALRLRAIARGTKDAAQTRRLLALAAVYDGARRTEAAAIGGVTLQIVRDWVIKFNAHGPDGLIDRKAPGQPSKLNDTHRAALKAVIESGPTPAVDGVVRWRLVDLCQWIWEEFRVGIAKQTLSRELRAMGYRKLSARPRHHAQADGAIEDFKKASPRLRTSSHATKKIDPAAIEVWFADEARVGQKNKITRRWARRGSRPSAPHDQRTALDLYLRRHLPQGRQGRGSCLAPLQHRGDEPASGRDRDRSGAGGSRRARPRSGRVAPVRQAHRAAEHHAGPAAGQMPRTQPGRECLAVHPRQLALQSSLPLLRRHPRTLLLCLEQAH